METETMTSAVTEMNGLDREMAAVTFKTSAVTENGFHVDTAPVVNGHDSSVDTSFRCYPKSRPFIDTESLRDADRPVTSFPESNRDGVLSALQSLQEKMKKLEMERREAENNLKTLASDTQLYKTSLMNDHFHLHPSHSPRSPPPSHSAPDREGDGEEEEKERHDDDRGNVRPQQTQVDSQLSSAETRCQLLEKQLDYMRKMVITAERERTHAVQKVEVMQHKQSAHDTPSSPIPPDYHSQQDRIGELERDHLRLTTTQTLAESKIKELEKKLSEERQHRKMLQGRTADMERQSQPTQQIILHTPSSPEKPPPSSNVKTKKSAASKKKKKKVSARKQAPAKPEPNKHYRLNLADIPFVAGKSTAPSHAVGANIQRVLAMMKTHNTALCSNGHNHGHGQSQGQGGCNGESGGNTRTPSSLIPAQRDLADLLAQLQDEFGQLSLEHQDYLHALQEARDPQVRADLEHELDSLVVRMEAKGQQISKVRQHQHRFEDAMRPAKQRASKKSDPAPRPTSALGRLQSNQKLSHPHSHASGNVRPKSSLRPDREVKYNDLAPPTLNVLRDMRKLQTTLRRDDLSWE